MHPAPSLSTLSISFDAHDHNTRAPTTTTNLISRLKLETLGYILFLASRDNKSCRKGALGNTGNVARRTAQVNRQWREAALANKYIWLGPVLSSSWYSSLWWTETVLMRSHPLPLDLVVPSDIKRENYPHVIAMIRKEHRIRSLEINLNPIPIPDASVLEAKHPPGRIVAGRSPLYVVDNLDLDIARPQSSLHGIPHPSAAPKTFFPTKALRNLTFGQECFIPIVLLLDGLKSLECLKTLRIHHPHEDYPSSSPPSNPPEVPALKMLNLNLKELSVTASISMCASVVKNISLPPSCSIRLECHDAGVGLYLDDVLLKMKQALSSWRCETDSESNGRQSLFMGATHIGFSLEGPQDGRTSSKTNNHPYLGLSLHWRRSKAPFQSLVSLLPLLLSAFRTSHNSPTILTIDADHSLAITRAVRNPILDWLMDTPTIQALEFKTYDAFIVLEPLFRLRNRSRAITNKILPTLCDLTFHDITYYTPNLSKSWRRLVRGLQRRQRARCPVTHIEFINCCTLVQSELNDMTATFEEMIRTISPFVEEIVVDGEELDYDSTTSSDLDETAYDTDSTVHQDSDIEL